MKRAVVFLLFLLFCPSSLPAQSPKHLLLGLASISGGIDVLYVTKKTGAFKRNGLDVDFILFQGGSQALQVLLAGDVKIISGGGGTAAQRARLKGAGNVLVATYTPTMPFQGRQNRHLPLWQLLGFRRTLHIDPAWRRAGEGSHFDADRQPARAAQRLAERCRGRRPHRRAEHAACAPAGISPARRRLYSGIDVSAQ